MFIAVPIVEGDKFIEFFSYAVKSNEEVAKTKINKDSFSTVFKLHVLQKRSLRPISLLTVFLWAYKVPLYL